MKKAIISIILVFALTLSATAAAFKPSVEKKENPEPKKDPQGYIAEIIDDIGEIIKKITDLDLIITPFARAKEAIVKGITAALLLAKEELTESENLGDLIEGIDKIVQRIFPGISVEDLVITDIFDMTLINGNNEILEIEGNRIRVTFDTEYVAKPLVVLRPSSGIWETVSDEDVTLNDDGSLTVIFDKLGVVAFMAPKVIVEEPGNESPKTGVSADLAGVAALAVLGAVSLAGVELVRRKKED